MKKVILLSFLFLILSCSNDSDPTTLNDFTPNERSSVSINISNLDGFSFESCPDIDDSSFLIKDNSLLSGLIGHYGELKESKDNIVLVYSCIISSKGNNDYVIQRFGGVFKTTNGQSISVQGIVGIDRLTQHVSGNITIDNLDNNGIMIEEYRVKGNIKKSGSCIITGRSIS